LVAQTEWKNVVAACESLQPAQVQSIRHAASAHAGSNRHRRQLIAAKRMFPPNYLHESWLDYLYWDSGDRELTVT